MEKATFRLPEWELERMREQSRQQRRSLNAIVAEVLARGLGQAPAAAGRTAVVTALGPLLQRPALTSYVPEAGAPSPVSLTDALDWTRGDR